MFKILTVLAAGLLSACIVQPEAYDIEGKDVEAVFVHTADIHSRLLPYDMDVMLTDQNLGIDPDNAPFGGIARLSAFVKQQRRDFGRVAYMESGDVFQGAPIFNSFGGEPEFRAMTQLQVDAFAIGNHEFDEGTQYFVNQARRFANFPMLASNYILSDPDFEKNIATGRIANPYTIINLKGLRVGVIGLGYVGGSPSFGGASRGVVALRIREVLQQYIDFLRPQVDLVAVVSHASYHDDLEYIPRTEGLDIVFGGHLHIALDPPNVVQDCDVARLERERDRYRCDTPEKLNNEQQLCQQKRCQAEPPAQQAQCQQENAASCLDEAKLNCQREKETRRYQQRLEELDRDVAFLKQRGCHPRNVLLVHSGAFLKYIGRLQVTLRQCHRLKQREVCLERDATDTCVQKVPRRCVGDKSGTNDWEVVAHDFRLIPVDRNLPQDPQMLQLLEPFTMELSNQQLLTQVVGYTPRRIFRFSKGTGDSEVGNMLTDAMVERSQVWADFSITNSLGVRSDLVTGPITNEQMTNVFPFDNAITVMYLSGYEVQEMMDFVAQRSASRGCQSQAQVSGLTATLNCGGCPGKGGNTCLREPYDGVACAQRVTIGGSGRPCKDDKDCEVDGHGQPTGEICTSQKHPDPSAAKAGKPYRCWQPISCTRSYRLATNDYIAHGGSGFTVLARNTTQKNLKIPLREATKDYIVNMPACSQILPTYQEKLNGTAPRYLFDASQEQSFKEMEKRARDGDVAGAQAAYTAVVQGLVARKGDLDTKIEAETNDQQKRRLTNEREAVVAYLGCVSETVEDGLCLGLACWQVRQCKSYKVNDVPRCETLSRVRAALRCLTLPCVRAGEDGRIDRIFRDAAGPPHTDPDYPG